MGAHLYPSKLSACSEGCCCRRRHHGVFERAAGASVMAVAQTVIFQSDKVLIRQTGTERLDISVDKWAALQSWRDAVADKMPSAKGGWEGGGSWVAGLFLFIC